MAEGAGDGTDADPPVDDVGRVLVALHPDVEHDGNRVMAWFEPQPEHRGNPGWLHGGMAATVLDHVCARAGAAAIGSRVVTGTLDLRYPQAVALDGGPYRVVAEAAEPRGRTVRVTGAIVDGDGRPMVEAKAMFVARPAALGG
ncbi:MAG: PaaI family thioesterase [Acidimicrobiia bacterium]|nr:PaaI family thioesterase [Acidimicrobiia bacterium]